MSALFTPVLDWIAVVTNFERVAGIYLFLLDKAKEIAAFLEKRYLIRKGNRQTTALLVNGTQVPLKDFIQEALAETVHRFVKTLKFQNDIKDIELRIKLEE